MGRSCWERSDQGEWLCRTREAESINKTTPPGPARVMCQLSCYDPIKWWIIITKYLKSFSFLVFLFCAFSIIIHLSPTNNNCTTLWLWCEHRLQRTGLWCVCCVSRVSHSWSPGDPLRTEHRDQRSRSQGRGAGAGRERERGLLWVGAPHSQSSIIPVHVHIYSRQLFFLSLPIFGYMPIKFSY